MQNSEKQQDDLWKLEIVHKWEFQTQTHTTTPLGFPRSGRDWTAAEVALTFQEVRAYEGKPQKIQPDAQGRTHRGSDFH